MLLPVSEYIFTRNNKKKYAHSFINFCTTMDYTKGDKVSLKTLQHDTNGVLRIIDETYQLIQH